MPGEFESILTKLQGKLGKNVPFLHWILSQSYPLTLARKEFR